MSFEIVRLLQLSFFKQALSYLEQRKIKFKEHENTCLFSVLPTFIRHANLISALILKSIKYKLVN